MDLAPSTSEEIDLVLFEIAGRTYGADVVDVSRVAAPEGKLPQSRRLGTPKRIQRGLVVRSGSGETLVPIDRLVGFRRVHASSLRKLPGYASGLAEPAVVGFLVEEGALLILIDLEALVKEEKTGDAGPQPRAKASAA